MFPYELSLVNSASSVSRQVNKTSRLREHTKTVIHNNSTKRNFPNYDIDDQNIYPIRESPLNVRKNYVTRFNSSQRMCLDIYYRRKRIK